MGQSEYRALVVDDDLPVRNLTVRALCREGFCCDAAADGLEARKLLAANHYDLLVTDLRMPNLHGHALVGEVVVSEDRPIIIVLTGILDARLAKDLITRGAEYVEFKPVRYDFFAAKARAVVERRLKRMKAEARAPLPPPRKSEPDPAKEHPKTKEFPRVTPTDIHNRLKHFSKVLPMSPAAFDVFNMASSGDSEAQQLAAAIARDSSLSVDVLRLANSAFYGTSAKQVVELEEAVVRIGQKRIGELALATSTLATLTANLLPWINVELAWHRSMAAGVAVELLLAETAQAPGAQGLFLSALMHMLGRIVLGMLFPDEYSSMVSACEKHEQTLLEYEKRVFPISQGEVMARLLETWKIPHAVHEPLKYFTDGYVALAALPEPARTRTELVKLAVLIAQIAVGEWELWDQVELPPAPVLRRLGLDMFSEIISKTKSDLETIVSMGSPLSARGRKAKTSRQPESTCSPVSYCSLSPEPFDFLAQIIPWMGIQLKTCGPEIFDSEENVLVNCIWTHPKKLAACIGRRSNAGTKLIICDADNSDPYHQFGRVLAVPLSYGALRSACRQLTQDAMNPAHVTPEEGVDAPGANCAEVAT